MSNHHSAQPFSSPNNHRFLPGIALRTAAAIFGWLALLTCAGVSRGQDIPATVAPNVNGSANFVDIQNTTGGDWYFYTAPTPAQASMSRMDSSEISEYPWGSAGNFQADPGNYEQDRIYAGEFLRVYPGTLAAGSLIQVAYATTPVGTQYHFNVTVTGGAQVTSINIADPSPSSASVLHWMVTFDRAISGVTAANFSFANSDGIAGVSIASVTANSSQPSTTWTVTVNTGSGTGLLGLNWAGHQSESPSVPNGFTGQDYQFSIMPVISQEPASVGINVGSTASLSIQATLRDNGAIGYQWYSGTSVNPGAATAISGATGTTYVPPTFNSVGTYQFFCRAYTPANPNTYADSTTAIITVVEPPQITTEPQNTFGAPGQTATFNVAAIGTSLNFQWYSGTAPDTSNPVGGNSSTFTTSDLSANSSFWVRVSNPGPTVANSATVSAAVIHSITPASPSYTAPVNTTFPANFVVLVRDSYNNPIQGVPVTFIPPTGANAGGTFSGGPVIQVSTDVNGLAEAPAFTANGVAGGYVITANYYSVGANLLITNTPVLNSASHVTFLTDVTNNFTVKQTGLTSPVFSETGALPQGVTFNSAGTLQGDPASGTGGVYPITITVGDGLGAATSQNFTLTLLEKNVLLAHPNFNTNGAGWILNGDTVNGGPIIANNFFNPTDGSSGEDRSAWFAYPLYVGAFEASFVYQDPYGNGADGVAFVVQNDPRGTAALGVNGGGLGYSGITPSVALDMNLYSGAMGGPSGIMLGTNGVGAINGSNNYSGRAYQSTAPVNLDVGNPILVNLVYLNGVLEVSFIDTVYSTYYQTQFPVDIPAFVGTNSAYVGITGSEGSVVSVQLVSDFTFVPYPTLNVATTTTNTVVVSWPASVGGFALQSKADPSETVWTTVGASVHQVGNENQVIVPVASHAQFYQLTLPNP